ncbi:flagellar biosynthesis repressor FlbT [Fodinicurvata sediminis]|uniref:flagellar biosynthesis repressor FlbT n=1 Tax=Fodinicurvata sediminis TaxID=1121832 RepID=UPI0003B476D2|nr:flagellar biosynthesis repressor FlbT [Fodinicurvata sediminis]
MGLILKLKKGEHLVVNGALLRFERASKIVLKTKSAVMHDRQIMRPDEVTTPAAHIYFAIQNAYMAEDEDRPAYVDQAETRIAEFREASTLSAVHEVLDAIQALIWQADFFQGLQMTRQLLEYESALLGMADARVSTELDVCEEVETDRYDEVEMTP